jgi:hypothetical protein
VAAWTAAQFLIEIRANAQTVSSCGEKRRRKSRRADKIALIFKYPVTGPNPLSSFDRLDQDEAQSIVSPISS